MGKKENPLLVYYNQPERFAQLLNGWLFQGRSFLEAGDVKEADRRMEEKGGRRKEYRGRSRDLFKRLDNAVVRLYVGAEPMEYVDYAMPLRVMDSDMLSYVHQKKAISKEHMKRRDLKQDEYLSRFSKQDRLLPVITLVLYCGEKPWDGARCLHEMLELSGLPEELKAYVENYSIHILDVCHTPDDRLREFPAELCFLLMCIKYAKDKEAFLCLTERAEVSVVSEDTYETIAEYLGEPELLESEAGTEGGRDMCKAIRELVEDGEKRGIEKGIEKGIGLAKQILKLAKENIPADEIARQLSISEKEVRQLLD